MNQVFNLALGQILREILKPKIREGSIKAVKSYIVAVKTARLVTIGVFALGVTASILVTGVLFLIVGLIGLAPTPENFPVVLIATGIVLSLLASIVVALAFSQERWLKMSKSYELMETALGPWPGVLPPNPLKNGAKEGETYEHEAIIRRSSAAAMNDAKYSSAELSPRPQPQV